MIAKIIKKLSSKAKLLSKKLNINSILITMGSDGMMLVGKDNITKHIKATSSKEVFDVTGAGDTVQFFVQHLFHLKMITICPSHLQLQILQLAK